MTDTRYLTLSPPQRVTRRQSNYGDYALPAGFVSLPAGPLYLTVAVWGWQLGCPFTREVLAAAFQISLSRAGDVMSYIRRACADRIASRQHYEQGQQGQRQRYLQILSAPSADIADRRSSLYRARTSAGAAAPRAEQALQELRSWFLTCPLGQAKKKTAP